MSRHTLKLLILLSAGVGLFGCQTKLPIKDKSVVVDDLSLQQTQSQDRTINNAIKEIQLGEILKAEILINQVLRANPKHELANKIKIQLNQPLSKLVGTNRTTKYKVKKGDSMGSIAKQWLGDAIYFVGLARLNNIKIPSQIAPGDVLIIPVTQKSPLAKKENRRSLANLALLKKYIDEKHYYKSLSRMGSIYVLKTHYKALFDLQKRALKELRSSLVSISQRRTMIKKINYLNEHNQRKVLKKEFDFFINHENFNVLIDEFLLLYENGSYHDAAMKLIAAKKMPISQSKQKGWQATEDQLVAKLHEKAMILRKDQELARAVEKWGTILKIQPTNPLALKYFHRTKKLLKRLESL